MKFTTSLFIYLTAAVHAAPLPQDSSTASAGSNYYWLDALKTLAAQIPTSSQPKDTASASGFFSSTQAGSVTNGIFSQLKTSGLQLGKANIKLNWNDGFKLKTPNSNTELGWQGLYVKAGPTETKWNKGGLTFKKDATKFSGPVQVFAGKRPSGRVGVMVDTPSSQTNVGFDGVKVTKKATANGAGVGVGVDPLNAAVDVETPNTRTQVKGLQGKVSVRTPNTETNAGREN